MYSALKYSGCDFTIAVETLKGFPINFKYQSATDLSSTLTNRLPYLLSSDQLHNVSADQDWTFAACPSYDVIMRR